MGRIIALGDTHGRPNWKEIANQELNRCDRFIFVGDYFDSHDKDSNGKSQIENFKEIVQLKLDNPQKVVLLIGNHDFHYIKGVGETYSGFQSAYAMEIGELVERAIKDGSIQLAHIEDGILFSHAGLTKTWLNGLIRFNSAESDVVMNNIDPQIDDVLINIINDYLVYQPKVFTFAIGDNFSQTGDDVTQGPLWVRPYSLSKDKVSGVWYVVGHTQVRKLSIVDDHQIILIDCLGESGEYLIIEDGKPKSSNG
jgi:predicted MPP superfamily phosphohydrolase